MLGKKTVDYMRLNHLRDGKDMAGMGQPIWSEIEKTVFEGAVIKVTAYRGITEEYWSI